MDISTTPSFTWTAVSNATTYAIDIATDAEFTEIVYSAWGLVDPGYTPMTLLNNETEYYWRIWAENSCGTSEETAVFSFTTFSYKIIYIPVILKP